MNIVYLLTNLDKKEGEKRFYIGSKTECVVENYGDINKIVCLTTGKIYNGSSSCIFMQEDLKNCRFTVSILEKVGDKKNLLATERKHMRLLNAVKSSEYYNMSEATVGGHSYNRDDIKNKFGETLAQVGGRNSQISKKNRRAIVCGFANLSEMCLHIYTKRQNGETFKKISNNLGSNNRGFARLYIKEYDIDKYLSEKEKVSAEKKHSIRNMYLDGASIKFIAKFEKLEILTIVESIGELLQANKQFLVAIRKGQTPEELETTILKKVLEGQTVPSVCREMKITTTSGYRYFYKALRKRLKSSDF